MASPILVTKLFIPATQPKLVSRPRLFEQLNAGLHRKLTLISAPAGFGKTTLISAWLKTLQGDAQRENSSKLRIAWLSLDEGDNDLTGFITYIIAALNHAEGLDGTLGKATLAILQSPQPLPIETILTSLINEIAAIPGKIIVILDDYHLIDSQPVHDSISFLLENQPPQMHLVIASREDPLLPISRLRVRNQLTELRATDLRFITSETAEFLNQVMDLKLSNGDIAALESRTEGWVAGLQLAAISLMGQPDTSKLIESFTGSNRLVLDYLIEEVLNLQPEYVQNFLLQTAILDRLCGALCNAVTLRNNSQQILEYLERANLFIIPLDNERQWYRYHHLFAELLRQRLHIRELSQAKDAHSDAAQSHLRASIWYEEQGMLGEAFRHAVAANDIGRAARLAEGDGVPIHFRGVVSPLLEWLESLPTEFLDSRPALWVIYASVLLVAGQPTSIEEKLQAAEKTLEGDDLDDKTKDLLGIIASTRAALAAMMISGQPAEVEEKLQSAEAALQDVALDDVPKDLVGRIAPMRATAGIGREHLETMITQSRLALAYALPDNLIVRTSSLWLLGVAYQLRGEHTAASQAYAEVISISLALGNNPLTIAATIGLGQVQEEENKLYQAAQTYQRALQLISDLPLPIASEAHLGLARIHYQWNDLKVSKHHGEQSVQIARQIKNDDRLIACELFLARLKLAQGDILAADGILDQTTEFVRKNNLTYHLPLIAATQVTSLLQRENLAAATDLAAKYDLPISQVRVFLAQGDPSAALSILEPLRQQVAVKGSKNELLKINILYAVALHEHDEKAIAIQVLENVLALAEPEGFMRIFVDEGLPMARLLYAALSQGISLDYVQRLLAAFPPDEPGKTKPQKHQISDAKWIEPLSERELEVLQYIAEGLTNQEIASKLYISLNTVKAHSQNIYGKLGVKSRTQASARARSLGILSAD